MEACLPMKPISALRAALKGAVRFVLAPVVVVMALFLAGPPVLLTETGCTKQQAESVLDVARFTIEQLACMGAEIELGATSPAVVAIACGPGLDAYLKEIEKFILAQQRAKMLVAAKRAAMAAPDAGAPPPPKP